MRSKRATKRQKSVINTNNGGSAPTARADTSGSSERRGRGDSNGLTKKQRCGAPAQTQQSVKRRMAKSATSTDPIKKQKQSDIHSFLSPRRSDGPDLT